MDRRSFLIKSATLTTGYFLCRNAFADNLVPDNDLVATIFQRPLAQKYQRYSYGQHPQQFVDLRLPNQLKENTPLAIVIHGGYWRNKYDLAYMSYFCEELTQLGIASLNIEYRRIGDPGGAFPGTFLDVASAVDFSTALIAKLGLQEKINLNNTCLIGHSAGGHLAAWASSRENIAKNSVFYTANAFNVKGCISLAGLLDLEYASEHHLSNDAVKELLNGESPQKVMNQISPIDMLPITPTVWVIHGEKDSEVPIEISDLYVEKAKQKGTSAHYVKIADAGHFDIVNPESPKFVEVKNTIIQAFA